jgi:DNA polymerase III subunit epsilon
MDAAKAAIPQKLVFVDLETTGGNCAYDRITEVGIVRVENGELVDEWSSLVNPECPIPEYIESFTGISNQMVAAAPRFRDIAPLVRDKLQGAVFAAHNARFDYSFLRSEFRRLGMQFSAKVLCTVKLSRRLFPEHARHNLDVLMERHGLRCDARHRALGDARVLHDFWRKLHLDVPQEMLADALAALLAAPKLLEHLPADLADELPEGPGVYRFFGADRDLLYVGRSNSLRTRMLEQLAAQRCESGGQPWAPQVRSVDWLQTAGELGSRLRETEWIRSQKPAYNRRAPGSAGSFTLRFAEEASGRVEFRPIGEVEPGEFEHCFGLFHAEKDARKALLDIARAQRLCLKILGQEQSDGSCFARQVGRCKGACIGKEPLALHDVRAKLALSSLKLKVWPFPGRIALRERDTFAGAAAGEDRGADLHVLDHWVYLGTARSEQELDELASKQADGAFDADVYRILVRHFSKHPKLDWHLVHRDSSYS